VYVAGFTPRERLDRGTPSPEITFNAFCELCLVRHGATVAERTRKTLSERLRPVREGFGTGPLAELEGAADDIARWASCVAARRRNPHHKRDSGAWAITKRPAGYANLRVACAWFRPKAASWAETLIPDQQAARFGQVFALA
jgi:hypothetical protein